MNGFSSLNERARLQFPAARASGFDDCQVAFVRIFGLIRPGDHTWNTLAHGQGLAGQQQDTPQEQAVTDRDLAEVIVLGENNPADLDGVGRDTKVGGSKKDRRQANQIMAGVDQALRNGAINAFIDQ